ncbi:MAG: cyclic nucleotide-binding domain-containing protein [Actinomycetes bacterium]
MAKADEVITALKGSELFSELSAKGLKNVREAGKEFSFGEGDEIVVQGKLAGRFFVIIEGTAKVIVNGRTRGHLGPSDAFGEISLLDGGARSASVVATSPVRTFSLAAWNFKPLLHSEPQIADAVVRGLCRRVRELEGNLLA